MSMPVFFRRLIVLIDTWWNVNELRLKSDLRRFQSFNRYMVECELFNITTTVTFRTVLIDTWWNVNEKQRRASILALGF